MAKSETSFLLFCPDLHLVDKESTGHPQGPRGGDSEPLCMALIRTAMVFFSSVPKVRVPFSYSGSTRTPRISHILPQT
jgi:hypothetical protein